MKDEVKEILDDKKVIIDQHWNYIIIGNEKYYDLPKRLLDYITNLQEENMKLINENETIKNIKYTVEETIYKSRNEKAIEYINHEIFKRTILVGVGTKKYIRNILDNVLNILNGGDNN